MPPHDGDFVKLLGLHGLSLLLVLLALPLFQLIEDANLSVRFDERGAAIVDLLRQLGRLLGQDAGLGLQHEVIALRRHDLGDVHGAEAGQAADVRREIDDLAFDVLTLGENHLLGGEGFGEAAAQLVAMDFAESAERLKAEAEARHGLLHQCGEQVLCFFDDVGPRGGRFGGGGLSGGNRRCGDGTGGEFGLAAGR